VPELSNASGIGMYILDRGTKTLETVHSASSPASSSTWMPRKATGGRRGGLLSKSHAGRGSRYQTESVLPKEDLVISPRSVLFVPMFAHSELVGSNGAPSRDRLHYFSQSEQAAMQHLANQWLRR